MLYHQPTVQVKPVPESQCAWHTGRQEGNVDLSCICCVASVKSLKSLSLCFLLQGYPLIDDEEKEED